MEYGLAPFAKYMGISKKKEVTRFAEQAWLVLYCTTFWSLGFVCASFALVQPLRFFHLTFANAWHRILTGHASAVHLLHVSLLVESQAALGDLAKP